MKINVMTMCAIVAVLTIGALLAGHAQAALVMEIDTANEQFRLTGSDSGTPFYWPDFGGYVAIWTLETGNFTGSDTHYQDLDSDLFSQDFLMEVFTAIHYDDPFGSTTTLGAAHSLDFSTVTGSGIWVDYSSMAETLKTDYESRIGGILPVLDVGTGGESGWSPVSIQAVPEPATMALLGLGSLFLLRRRKGA